MNIDSMLQQPVLQIYLEYDKPVVLRSTYITEEAPLVTKKVLFLRAPYSPQPYCTEIHFQCTQCKEFHVYAGDIAAKGLCILYHMPCAPPACMPTSLRQEMQVEGSFEISLIEKELRTLIDNWILVASNLEAYSSIGTIQDYARYGKIEALRSAAEDLRVAMHKLLSS